MMEASCLSEDEVKARLSISYDVACPAFPEFARCHSRLQDGVER
jgi:hypothetical protein